MSIAPHALKQIPFFEALDDDALQQIAAYGREINFSPRQMVISEGDPCRAVYFVIKGIVRIRRMSLQGREHVLAYRGPGEPFNLVPALDGGPNQATVDALSAVTLYTIPCQHFRRIMQDHPKVALAVLEHLATEVRRLGDMVEDLALYPVRARLARFLLNHAESSRPPRRWTQEEIATNIGTVREIVSRTLRTFIKESLVRRERGRIVIVDRKGLERIASGES